MREDSGLPDPIGGETASVTVVPAGAAKGLHAMGNDVLERDTKSTGSSFGSCIRVHAAPSSSLGTKARKNSPWTPRSCFPWESSSTPAP